MMRTTLLSVLAAVVCVACATPNLLAYSTNAHFLCRLTSPDACDRSHPATLTTLDLAPLLQHLTSHVAPSGHSLLPLAQVAVPNPPELVVLVHSVPSTDVSQLLRRVAEVAPSQMASAFHGATDESLSLSHVDRLVSRILPSVSDFERLVEDPTEPIFTNRVPDLLAITVGDAHQLPSLIAALRIAAKRAGNNVAVVFAMRQGDAPAAGDAEPAPKDPSADSPGGATVDNQTADAGPSVDANVLLPPYITPDQLAGLLVAAIFLIIFIPGFMCLWRIQTPQTFAMLDSNDMKKKIQ